MPAKTAKTAKTAAPAEIPASARAAFELRRSALMKEREALARRYRIARDAAALATQKVETVKRLGQLVAAELDAIAAAIGPVDPPAQADAKNVMDETNDRQRTA